MAGWLAAITSLFSPAAPARRHTAAGSSAEGGIASLALDTAAALRVERDRLGAYSEYEQMDREAPEAARALTVYADTVTQDSRGETRAVEVTPANDAVSAFLRPMLRETRLLEDTRGRVRALRKRGDVFCELVFDAAGTLRRVKDMPARTVRRRVDAAGTPDPLPWRQTDPLGSTEVAALAEWQVAHLAEVPPGELYGYELGQLSGARRPWRALEMAQSAALSERVLRTGSRTVIKVDVTGLSTDEAVEYIGAVRREYRRSPSTRSSTGSRGGRYAPPTPMDEFFVPWTSGGPQTPVDVLKYGSGEDQLHDVKLFMSRYLAALDVPRYMLGVDEDLRSRSATTFIDAAFLRSVYRTRGLYLDWLGVILDRALYAKGFYDVILDGREGFYSLRFRPLQLADEKLLAEIEFIRSQSAKIWGADLSAAPPEFLLTHFLGLPEDEAEEVSAGLPEDPPAAGRPAESALLRALSGSPASARLEAAVGAEAAAASRELVAAALLHRLRRPPGGHRGAAS